ncbi:DUF2080 family transposase-associated protein [Methanoculleus sp. 7T]|nr:DUF2080 family transposase-associated protein [Methanoculleus sp. 7T]MCK8519845.1 DUF2080 family transposase-associated protein [Methanoculleus sp. 7T]
MEQIEMTFRGYEVIEKIVAKSGNSGRVYVPPSWIGKMVKVVLLDPLDK